MRGLCVDRARTVRVSGWRAVLTADADVTAAARSRSLTPHDIAVVKFLLCSGQGGRLAAPDRANMYRNGSEQVFHTMNGQQALLHPSSCLVAVLAEQRAAAAPAGGSGPGGAAAVVSRPAAAAPSAPVAAVDAADMTSTELLCYGKVRRAPGTFPRGAACHGCRCCYGVAVLVTSLADFGDSKAVPDGLHSVPGPSDLAFVGAPC
jgi:hypothetical protein